MNAYTRLNERQQAEVDAFPMMFAFSNAQFEEGMREWGLEPGDSDQICSMPGTGGYFRKADAPALHEMLERHEKERAKAIAGDKTGKGFIRDMFAYELAGHEYSYTQDVSETLEVLGLTAAGVDADPRLAHGLQLAKDALGNG